MTSGLKGVGRLEPGWQADFQLIAPGLPTPLEEHNLYDQLLLYCHATDVRATVVAGNPLMRDGQVLNVNWTELKKRRTPPRNGCGPHNQAGADLCIRPN